MKNRRRSGWLVVLLSSQSCISAKTSSFPTSQAGDIPACRRVPDRSFLTLAPDWLCETLSPTTEKLDRTKKLGIYARERVPHVWLVDPET